MTEWDVLEYLKNLRKTGDDSFKTTKEISEGILLFNKRACSSLASIRRKLINLDSKGFLERKTSGSWRDWQLRFRVKEVYLNGNKDLQKE